ncbi:hypothetical protein JNJ66_05000 [Candidatus Saccharibacteria bacterium]|nr:hypothetical protein [Candidatus Saccharibacteria bacterium]
MSKNKEFSNQQGEVNGLAILLIVAVFLLLAVSGFAVWAFMQKTEAQSNLNAKIKAAQDEARREQIKEDNKDFAEREKEPYRDFTGPKDLGAVKFKYPKTWSVYVDKGGANGTYEAYFQPLTVTPLSEKKPRALRLSITPRGYDEVVKGYESKVKSGDLRSSPVTIEGFNGLKLEGSFSKEVPEATMIIFKIRDKTMMISSESPEFFRDFNDIILKNLKYNE